MQFTHSTWTDRLKAMVDISHTHNGIEPKTTQLRSELSLYDHIYILFAQNSGEHLQIS